MVIDRAGAYKDLQKLVHNAIEFSYYKAIQEVLSGRDWEKSMKELRLDEPKTFAHKVFLKELQGQLYDGEYGYAFRRKYGYNFTDFINSNSNNSLSFVHATLVEAAYDNLGPPGIA